MFQRVSCILIIAAAASVPALCQLAQPIDPNYQMPGGFSIHHMGEQYESVSGVVRSQDGAPVNNARVEIVSPRDGTVVAVSYTGRDGAFVVQNVPTGDYNIAAQHGVSEVQDSIHVDAGGAQVQLKLPMQSANSVQGGVISVNAMKVPDKAREALDKAQKAIAKRNMGDAQKLVDKALAIDPQYADALTVRGILKLDSNQIEAALQDFQQAIKLDNNCSLAYIADGAAENMVGKWDDAILALQHGLTLNPTSWQGYFELGKSYVAKGNYDAALDQLSRAEGIQPKYSAIYLLKAHALLGKKDYNNAIAQLEVYLKVDPKGPQSEQVRQALGRMQAYVAANPKP